jgi:ABC-type bacteriocin/lantibiotic exporter with double-glycine peptidase domain
MTITNFFITIFKILAIVVIIIAVLYFSIGFYFMYKVKKGINKLAKANKTTTVFTTPTTNSGARTSSGRITITTQSK